MEPKIKGGFVLLARKTRESELMDKPPLFAKLWFHILMEAEHRRESGKLARGQLLTSLQELIEAGSYQIGYRREYPTKKQVRAALDWFREQNMLQLQRTTRGMVITIQNYDFYQDPDNYKTTKVQRRAHEGHNEGHSEGNTKGTMRAHDSQDHGVKAMVFSAVNKQV